MQVSTPYMRRRVNQNSLRLVAYFSIASALVLPLGAQDDEFDEEVIELSPFVVTTTNDVGYLSTNSTSGTSLNVAIKDLPMAVQVINQEQISDLGASDLAESLTYSAGVFTDDNQAEKSVGATRATQGGTASGGGGDKSISSAGANSRFANTVYIRGLAAPYQNRMGFRYGGVVVTTNSAIALGGLMDAANIERVEVVKGPNSLLYGVGVLTGIVNVIPERPLPESRYEISTKMGSYDYKRVQVDMTGPVGSDWIPGELNWRLAGSIQARGDWTEYRRDKSEYWVAQLEYRPADWMKVFIEYQSGKTRKEGISSQWIYDDINNAKDSEFRNEYGEAFNWARYEGTIDSLRSFGPADLRTGLTLVDGTGASIGSSTQSGWQLNGPAFVGGGKADDYRITGPDTFAERDEKNFVLDLEFFPIDGLTINFGTFYSKQKTEDLELNFSSIDVENLDIFKEAYEGDSQLGAIYNSGGVYGVAMQQSVKDFFGFDFQVDPDMWGANYILPVLTDDVKLTEYWWTSSVVKSESRQFRLRATYTFDADLFGIKSQHTFLAGWSYIKDDVDFPDGSVSKVNASANPDRAYTFGDSVITADSVEVPVANKFDNDGLYYRSIANFEPLFFDGRNDGVNGHNVVREGDAYLNQVIDQQGIYGVYQGKFFGDRLEFILGARQDTYNARQKTYKRVNIDDDYLISLADDALEASASLEASLLYPVDSDEYIDAYNTILSNNKSSGAYVAAYYRDNVEDEGQAFFGYADRGGAADQTYGIVPFSEYDVFEEDVQETTGTFGVSFDATEEITFYGVISQGISPNTALRDGAGEIIPAEETFNKEVGVKFEFMDGRISGNVALFSIDRKNAIHSMSLAPASARWIDAATSLQRASNWNYPTYDSQSPSIYYVRTDYLVTAFADAFGLDEDKVNLVSTAVAGAPSYLSEAIELADIPNDLSYVQEYVAAGQSLARAKRAFLTDIANRTKITTDMFQNLSSQAPFNGNYTFEIVGIPADGLYDLHELTFWDPDKYNAERDEVGDWTTATMSTFGILYAAFMDRDIDATKNSLLQDIHPIRYNSLSTDAQPQNNNQVDLSNARGALVTYDETISGYEFEVFLTPTENLQFVINYTHIEREAASSLNFTDWENISGTDGMYVPPFTMLFREYGWESAGMTGAWVDYDAYAAAVAGSGGAAIALDSLGDAVVERISSNAIDETIAPDEFVSRNSAGQTLVFVDQRGDVINADNSAKASDLDGILDGVSLNFNPEDEFAVWAKYTFDSDHGILDGLSLNIGYKYIGPSKTSYSFNSVSPLAELTDTPDVGERMRVDLGASYQFSWQDIDWRLTLNIYDLFEDTYDVTTTTLNTRNPVTGEEVTKRTEKFYSPTTFRLGLSASF